MVSLRIASLDIRLEGDAAWPADLRVFAGDPVASPALTLSWVRQPGLVHPGWRGDASFEDLPDGSVRFRRADFEGRVDPRSLSGELRTSPNPGALRSALRYVVSLGLLARNGFLLHTAGLVESGRGYALFGPSGAGKSTAAALSEGRASVLGDELCALLRSSSGWQVHGTPFHGSLESSGVQGGAPLAAAVLLEQSERVEAAPLARREALLHLYPQVFRPSRSPELATRWLRLLDSLVRERPCLRLSFRRDPGFWTCLKEKAA